MTGIAEYIKLEPLISDLEDVIANYKDEHAFSTDFAATIVIDILNNIVKCHPAADVAPVVRCRECVWRPFWEEDHNDVPVCLLSGLYVRSEDDFCSYGERRSNA